MQRQNHLQRLLLRNIPTAPPLPSPQPGLRVSPWNFRALTSFRHRRHPSVLAVRLNGGPVGSSDYLQFEADADGKVSGSIPWQDRYTAGSTATINVLTGVFEPQR